MDGEERPAKKESYNRGDVAGGAGSVVANTLLSFPDGTLKEAEDSG